MIPYEGCLIGNCAGRIVHKRGAVWRCWVFWALDFEYRNGEAPIKQCVWRIWDFVI